VLLIWVKISKTPTIFNNVIGIKIEMNKKNLLHNQAIALHVSARELYQYESIKSAAMVL